MINCNMGLIQVEGVVIELLEDVFCITKSLKKNLSKVMGEEKCEKFLKMAFDNALAEVEREVFIKNLIIGESEEQ